LQLAGQQILTPVTELFLGLYVQYLETVSFKCHTPSKNELGIAGLKMNSAHTGLPF